MPAFHAIDKRTVEGRPEWRRLPLDLREAVNVVSEVLPFRTNEYLLRELIDWSRVPDDPMFQMTFPQQGMLSPAHYQEIADRLRRGDRQGLAAAVRRVRLAMNPHPSAQVELNVPTLQGVRLAGLQHKYPATILFFPAPGQSCHAYCTFCFRWAQFVDLPGMRFAATTTDDLTAYLAAHCEVSDVLLTGGDPLVMTAPVLRRFVEPLLGSGLEHVRTVRIGTKSPATWPYRFLTDPDADDLLRLFERVVEAGKHLALMVHFTHPVELSTAATQAALRRIRATGAEIRMQGAIVRQVNDRAEDWAALWDRGAQLGLIPYYAFVERDTGPRQYFEVPLARAYEIFRQAYSQVSGIARTVRGPVMSTAAGKVHILGTATLAGQSVFVLDFLQARNPEWVRRPFFAAFDPAAAWFDQLRPAGGEASFFGAPCSTSAP